MNQIGPPEQWLSSGTRWRPISLCQRQQVDFNPPKSTEALFLGEYSKVVLENKTKCLQQQTKFNPLNSDDPVAPGGVLFPYVKDSELTTILQSQQKFFSCVAEQESNLEQ